MTSQPDKHDPPRSVSAPGRCTAATASTRHRCGSHPLTMANSYLLPEDPASMDWSATDLLTYSRNGGANQVALETKLAAMDGGEGAVCSRPVWPRCTASSSRS